MCVCVCVKREREKRKERREERREREREREDSASDGFVRSEEDTSRYEMLIHSSVCLCGGLYSF